MLKGLLPLAAIGVIAGYAGAVLQTVGWGDVVPTVTLPKILPEHLAIKDPVYEGFDEDGGRYVVRSETAQQDLQTSNRIALVGITGELVDAGKSKTNLKAARGKFDGRANLLELFNGIEVEADSGLSARLATALVRTKEHVILSQDPVSVTMPSGTVTAKEMTLRQKLREITFVHDVVARFRPAPAEASATKARSAWHGGEAGCLRHLRRTHRCHRQPARRGGCYQARRLLRRCHRGAGRGAVDDARVARRIRGTGRCTGERPSRALTMGKVRRVLAMKPVAITQASGERVTSDAAEFDTIAQDSGADRRRDRPGGQRPQAVGDRAELDQRADTVVLTGAVTVTRAATS